MDTQIKRIRQKISQHEQKGWKLSTVYSVGYRFELVDEQSAADDRYSAEHDDSYGDGE